MSRPATWARSSNYEQNKETARQRALQRSQEHQAMLDSVVDRDPCHHCGVKAQDHEALGCRAYAGTVYR